MPNGPGDPHGVSDREGRAISQAVLFPVNMGNRGQNEFSVRDTFLELARASTKAHFVVYYSRRSGNFVFEYDDEGAISEATKIGKQVTGLECIVRRFSDLRVVTGAVPTNATTEKGSVVFNTPAGVRRVIYVALSEKVKPSLQAKGVLGSRIEILSWPSDQDVLCLYERPGESGDVGQVTRAVVNVLKPRQQGIYGTGRAVSVILDLLAGRNLRSVT